MTSTQTVTITRRTRNLGFGFATGAHQVYRPGGASFLVSDSPAGPSVTGAWSRIEQELDRARRIGGQQGRAFFVGGKRVVADREFFVGQMRELSAGHVDSVQVEVEA